MLALACLVRAQQPVRFAVIGDFGFAGDNNTAAVAQMINGWNPPADFILTVGDNAYSDKTTPGTLIYQSDVLAFYKPWIKNPTEDPQAVQTRFFPTLGNHDMAFGGGGFVQARLDEYRRTFALPPNLDLPADSPFRGRFYEFVRGPVHFYALDSNSVQGNNIAAWNGNSPGPSQYQWFKAALDRAKVAGTEKWHIPYFHHAPWHSGVEHAGEVWMRKWKFDELGVTAVLCGHVHAYERLTVSGIPFFVTGLAGGSFYQFRDRLDSHSAAHYPPLPPHGNAAKRAASGALFVEATSETIRYEFRTVGAGVIDPWPTNH
jgi:tartrate-resistant acid phosphatase type 5